MPQLDRFLSVLVSRGADSIELVEGEASTLVAGGASQPITKALTGPQLLMLLKEIAPAAGPRPSGGTAARRPRPRSRPSRPPPPRASRRSRPPHPPRPPVSTWRG